MIKLGSRTKKYLLIYLILWGITWVWGNFDADQQFDLATIESQTGVTTRIPFSQLDNKLLPVNSSGYYRSKSISISPCPFILIFSCSYQTHSLAGYGGLMGDFWFFGYNILFPIWSKWVS